MNETEAKIILRCQTPRYVKQIWQTFVLYSDGSVRENHSYPQIAHKCEELYLKGKLLRYKKGKYVYYKATKEAIDEALKMINEREEDRQREAKALKMMMNNRRITNFV